MLHTWIFHVMLMMESRDTHDWVTWHTSMWLRHGALTQCGIQWCQFSCQTALRHTRQFRDIFLEGKKGWNASWHTSSKHILVVFVLGIRSEAECIFSRLTFILYRWVKSRMYCFATHFSFIQMSENESWHTSSKRSPVIFVSANGGEAQWIVPRLNFLTKSHLFGPVLVFESEGGPEVVNFFVKICVCVCVCVYAHLFKIKSLSHICQRI